MPSSTDDAVEVSRQELANVVGPCTLPGFAQVRAYGREGQNLQRAFTHPDEPETPDLPRNQQDWV